MQDFVTVSLVACREEKVDLHSITIGREGPLLDWGTQSFVEFLADCLNVSHRGARGVA
jgi:hypothetical protein